MALDLVNSAQLQLQTALGTNYGKYLENMQDWFGQRVTKDFFDSEMSMLLTDKHLELHNSMMKLIVAHCSPVPPLIINDNTTTQPVYNNNNNNINNNNSMNIVHETYENSPGLVETTNSLGDSEYITINFVESEETATYENEVEESIEDVEDDIPADWLFKIDLINPSVEDNNSVPSASVYDRLPLDFVSQFQRVRNISDNSQDPEVTVVPNITHSYDISDRLNKNTMLKKHFIPPVENEPYLSVGSSIHGRFLLKAWECGLDGVDMQASNLVVEGVKEHIKTIVTAVIRQRRAFRIQNKRVFHSIGVPYPNPYLRQGHHLYDNPYGSDSTKMADVMQVPTLLPPMEERERMAALEIAASTPAKNCRFPSTKATLTDLLDVIENEPNLISKNDSRLKMKEIILQNYKGYGGSDAYEDEVEDDSQDLLPLCSY